MPLINQIDKLIEAAPDIPPPDYFFTYNPRHLHREEFDKAEKVTIDKTYRILNNKTSLRLFKAALKRGMRGKYSYRVRA